MDIENVDPEGDVILVVGPDKRRMRVDSRCLRRASKVFAAMFSTRFAEGQNLSPLEPKEVPLPEDDHEHMLVLCNAFHLKNEVLESTPTTSDMLNLAVLIDKYDCAEAVRFISKAWLLGWKKTYHQPWRKTYYQQDVERLVAAAYLMRDQEQFRVYTKVLVVWHESSLGLLRMGNVIPFHIYSKPVRKSILQRYTDVSVQIEEQRLTGRQDLLNTLNSCIRNPGCDCGCCWYTTADASRFKAHYSKKQFRELGSNGLGAATVGEACKFLDELDDSEWQQTDKDFDPCDRCTYRETVSASALDDITDRVRDTCAGLCLQCVRMGSDKSGHGSGSDCVSEEEQRSK